MRISRRLFFVLFADNNHGKTTMIRGLVSQGLGRAVKKQMKGRRTLVTPTGREIDSYIFGRSYQEVEKGAYGNVGAALDGNDPERRKRELIVMPSHVHGIKKTKNSPCDIDQMIDIAHSAGFDIICASVEYKDNFQNNSSKFGDIWKKPWDEKWTVPNPEKTKFEGQLDAIGRDLWF